MSNARNNKILDMTEGNSYSLLVKFAVPLILGNLFQQLYNLTDTWVIGNYTDNVQYSAVGACSPITMIIINGVIGLSTGMGIVISRLFGASDKEGLRRASQTSMVIAAVCAVIFSIAGVSISPALLRLTKVPEEAFGYAVTYLRIIFSFVTAQIVYNIGSAVLRAVGDSRRPFYFLVAASFTNIVLDLLLVIKFHMGVAGVAYATATAQMLAAVLTLIELIRNTAGIKLELKKWIFDKSICGQMLSVGLPTSLQMSINMVSNTFIQSYINALGTDFMSGYATYHKLEELLFLINNSLGTACMTFVSQNLGAGNAKRAKKGVFNTIVIGQCIALVVIPTIVIFAPKIIAFFNAKEAVVGYGTMALRTVTPLFFMHGMTVAMMYGLRGTGNSKGPFIAMLFCMVGVRLLYLYLMTKYVANTPRIVIWSYPAGWICMFITISIMFFRTDFESLIGSVYRKR